MSNQARISLFSINLKDAFPSYLSGLFNIRLSPQFFLILLLILLTFFFIWAIIKYVQLKRTLKEKYILLEVKPTYNSSQSSFSTKQLFTILHSLEQQNSFLDRLLQYKRNISFEIVSTKEGGIRYMLRVPSDDVSGVKKSLLAYLQGIEVNITDDYLPDKIENIPHETQFSEKEFILAKPFIYPLQDQTTLNEYDPMAYLTAHMTKLNKEELVSFHIIGNPILEVTHSSTTSYIQKIKHLLLANKDITDEVNQDFLHKLYSVCVKIISNKSAKEIKELSNSKQLLFQTIEKKINQPLYEVTIRLIIMSPLKTTIKKRIQGIKSSFDTFSTSYQRLRLKFDILSLIKNKLIDRYQYFVIKNRILAGRQNPILSVSELSSMYHLPFSQTTKTEDLLNVKSPKMAPPLSLKKSDHKLDIVFAHNLYGETTTPIGLTLEERERHTYVIGATGTGKTTMLLQMIYQDIVNGKGLAVVDPHGDLTERLLGVIPKERIRDVVYFNPYDIDYSIGLNILELSEINSEVERHREKDLIVSSIVSIFHKLYPARYSGPRMEHILRNTVLTALELENPTLFTVYKLLTDNSFRKQAVAKLDDVVLKEFWKNEFEKQGSYQKAEQISPITNKLGRFLTTTMTRRILNQEKSKLNFDEIMNKKKILICDLSKGKIGEDTSSFLGSLIIAKLQLAALKRIHIPEDKRTDFFLYIDEFQNFATITFAQILSEARKYHLNTILAHQTISQIEDQDLLKIILANVATVISFRTSNPSDESTILPIFAPQVTKNEISNLPSYSFYIKINALYPQDAFSGTTSNFLIKNDEDIRREVVDYSRLAYGKTAEKPVDEVKSVDKKVKIVKQSRKFNTKEELVTI